MNVYIDIETAPLPMEQIRAQMPVFIEADVKTGNRKDPEKIKAYIEEARIEHEKNWIARAALSPLTGSIVAIGWLKEGGTSSIMMEGEFSERDMIEAFFAFYQSQYGARWIGFNIARFDVPFLVRRAWTYGLEVPRFYNGRYLNSSLVDLLQLWQCGDAKEFISLDRIARYLGLPGKSMDGSAFAALKYENQEAAIEYLRNDLELTKAVAERLNVQPAKEKRNGLLPEHEVNHDEPLLTAKELAKRLGIDRRDIYRLKREGRIPFVPIGQKTALFKASDVSRALYRMSTQRQLGLNHTDVSGGKQVGVTDSLERGAGHPIYNE